MTENTKRMKRARINEGAPHWKAELPEDDEQFRIAMARRMHDILGTWRQCRLPLCRRARSCVASTFACRVIKPMSSRMVTRVQGQMQRALRKRMAEAGYEPEREAAPRRKDHQAANKRPKS